MKYFIESKGVSNNEWVLATQLESRNRDVSLPTKPEDIPQKGIKAWIKLVSGRLKPVTIRKVECEFEHIMIHTLNMQRLCSVLFNYVHGYNIIQP